MDIGDVTDPTLDGDFQTLLEVRQVRKGTSYRNRHWVAFESLLSLSMKSVYIATVEIFKIRKPQ